jgi:hypothetical protein
MSPPIDVRRDQICRRTDDLVWRELDDEVVLLDLRSSLYLTLNRTGRLMWERLAEPTTAARLTAVVAESYSLPPAEAAADVVAFLESLVARQLVELVAKADP